MKTPSLSCPYAEYQSGMVIHCRRQNAPCAHVYFKMCKGWWALSPMADLCPLRKEKKNGKRKPPAPGGNHPV